MASEAIKQKADPIDHTSKRADHLSNTMEAQLQESLIKKGIPIPTYLQQACTPEAIKRAMLVRTQSQLRKTESFLNPATPVNSPSSSSPREEEKTQVPTQPLPLREFI